MRACDECLRRTDLIAALGRWLDVEWRRRGAPGRVLALPDEVLLDAAGRADVRRRYHAFRPAAARAAIDAAGLVAACRCDAAYPERLHDLADPPAVLHVAGDPRALASTDTVAVVGARRATHYGLAVATDLGRGLRTAGVSVVSGLALGVDAAAHAGAMEARVATPAAASSRCAAAGPPGADGASDRTGADAASHRSATDGLPGEAGAAGRPETAPLAAGAPVAVLAGGADVPYPASKRRLYGEVRRVGAVVSELPPGFGVHRWAFVARNRLIAALAQVVVVVEATERSGSLITADLAAELGRTVAAVPGRVTCLVASGTNGLIRDGALLARGPADALDALAELTGRRYDAPEDGATPAEAGLEPHLRHLLEAVGAGHSTLPMLAAQGIDARSVLLGLGELEALGLVQRGFGGRYERVP